MRPQLGQRTSTGSVANPEPRRGTHVLAMTVS
jgi:hypothetical protein